MAEATEVILRYVGPDVDDGSIGVDDLLSALNGFSNAFYRLAERESHDQRQRIKVNGISRSSANIHLAILEMTGTAVVSPIVGKLTEIVLQKLFSVAKAKKHIQGGTYTTEIEVSGDNNRIVIVNGVNAKLPVDRDVLELLEKGTIDSDLDKMAAPLREDSIDAFEIRHVGKDVPDLHLEASDKPYFSRPRRETTITQVVTLVGTMNTISKTNNADVFITDAGRRIRYRFTNEQELSELYRQFAHLGKVRVRCTAKLDDNLEVISIEIDHVEPVEPDEASLDLSDVFSTR